MKFIQYLMLSITLCAAIQDSGKKESFDIADNDNDKNLNVLELILKDDEKDFSVSEVLPDQIQVEIDILPIPSPIKRNTSDHGFTDEDWISFEKQ